MPIDYAALREELENDPEGMGYAQLIEAGAHLALAQLMNSTTSPGADTINLGLITKNTFLLGVSPVALTLPQATDAVQKKWDRIIALASAAELVDVSNPNVMGILQLATMEGFITQEQVDAFTKRTGSRAEVIFGAGEAITHESIAIALR